jgi:transcriptional regulator CtsR
MYTDEYHQVQGDSQMVLVMKRMNRTREVESKRASGDPIRILDVLEAENVRLRNQVAELALQTEILREQVNVN